MNRCLFDPTFMDGKSFLGDYLITHANSLNRQVAGNSISTFKLVGIHKPSNSGHYEVVRHTDGDNEKQHAVLLLNGTATVMNKKVAVLFQDPITKAIKLKINSNNGDDDYSGVYVPEENAFYGTTICNSEEGQGKGYVASSVSKVVDGQHHIGIEHDLAADLAHQ